MSSRGGSNPNQIAEDSGLEFGRVRHLYLKPSPGSDEAFLVGVFVQPDAGCCEFVSVAELAHGSSVRSILGKKNGASFLRDVDQMKTVCSAFDRIEDIEVPFLGVQLGEVKSFATTDSRSYGKEHLMAASIFCRFANAQESSPKRSISNSQLFASLRDEVTHNNVFAASKLFAGQRVSLGRKRLFHLPISGNRCIGAPVSLVTSNVSPAKYYAEAWIARLMYSAERLGKTPSLYVLRPDHAQPLAIARIERAIEELTEIARDNDVQLRSESNCSGLAAAVLYDEGAG